jgi:hypothetical protein
MAGKENRLSMVSPVVVLIQVNLGSRYRRLTNLSTLVEKIAYRVPVGKKSERNHHSIQLVEFKNKVLYGGGNGGGKRNFPQR